jgi:hypothetical protein
VSILKKAINSSRGGYLTSFLSCAVVFVFLLCAGCGGDRQSFSHDVYVWQRSWQPSVVTAIDSIAPHIERLAVLAAEIEFSAGKPKSNHFQPDYASLSKTGRPVVLCVRIGAWSGPFDSQHKAAAAVLQTVSEVIEQAKKAGIEPAELQLDFDCADTQLAGYGDWLKQIRTITGDLKLSFTALPSWLRQPGFGDLLKEVDSFVLQVHSLQKDKANVSGYTLCDKDRAIGWVKEAERFDKEFSVALPTYGYELITDASGKLVNVLAEEPGGKHPGGFNRLFVRSDPEDMASLVNLWQQERPHHMKGIIWFRLPVADDQLNWPLEALLKVMSGITPLTDVQTSLQQPEPGLTEIVLENTGETMLYKVRVELAGRMDKLMAAEAISGFVLQQSADTIAFETAATREAGIHPDEKITIGWLRFAGNKNVPLTIYHEL